MNKHLCPPTKEVFKIFFTPEKRYCSRCRQSFRCSGVCPEGRWNRVSRVSRMKGNIMKLNHTACYCKSCLQESSLNTKYKKKRLEGCY